jgi:hypothetical protein
MSDQPEAVQVDDDFLWPSPEMRRRAIDEAVKIISTQVALKFEGQIDEIIATKLKKLVTELDAKVEEFKKLVEDGRTVLNSLGSIKQHDFAKITDDLVIRMSEIEGKLTTGGVKDSLGFNNEYDAKMALKGICEIIGTIVSYVKGNHQYSTIAYNIGDFDLKNRILGGLFADMAKHHIGKSLDKLENIASYGNRL